MKGVCNNEKLHGKLVREVADHLRRECGRNVRICMLGNCHAKLLSPNSQRNVNATLFPISYFPYLCSNWISNRERRIVYVSTI